MSMNIKYIFYVKFYVCGGKTYKKLIETTVSAKRVTIKALYNH